MQIRVRLFAMLRERAGADEVSLDLAQDATVADALRAVGGGHPELADALEKVQVVVAVNRSYVDEDHPLQSGDEVALVPPVSGGSGAPGDGTPEDPVRVRIVSEPISLDDAVGFVTDKRAGAVVSFQGMTREVDSLEYEAYAEMALDRMGSICREALERHGGLRVAADHRVGNVPLSESSVAVAASSAHRPAAFAIAREIIDRLKEEVPIWKKEVEGESGVWVEGVTPRTRDEP